MSSEEIAKVTEESYQDYKKIKGFEDVGYFLVNYVVDGGVVSKDIRHNDQIDVSDIVVVINSDVVVRGGTSFKTKVPNTTYFLDFSKSGDFTWGISHSSGVAGTDYLSVAEVTTDVHANVSLITDTAGERGGFRLKPGFMYPEIAELQADAATLQMFPAQDEDLDDTERIQRAIDYCANNKKTLIVDTGTYWVRALTLPPGTSILAKSAIFKKPKLNAPPYNYTVDQMKWIRMITITHSDDVDSSLTIINGLIMDGNAWEQWDTPSYDQEQASLIIASASASKAGRLRIAITNCHFQNNVSDGIHIVQNVIANISNCSSYDCFRGGLVITGGYSDINVNNFIFNSNLMNDGIDYEVDSTGYGGSKVCNVNLSNIVIDKDLDIGATAGSTVTLTNVKMKGATWSIGVSGNLFIENCDLINDGGRVIIQGTGKLKISNSILRGDMSKTQFAFLIQFYNAVDGSSIELTNCEFLDCTKGIGGGLGANTKVFVRGCKFNSDCTTPIGVPDGQVNFAPKELHVDGCTFDNAGYYLQNFSIYQPYTKIYLSGNKITNPANLGIYVHNPEIYYIGVNLFEYGGAVKLDNGAQPKFFGNRIVLVDADPSVTPTLRGLPGDVAILRDGTRKWEFAFYNGAPGVYAYVWNELIAAPTSNPKKGSTAGRPQKPPTSWMYFDTTLNKPVWCKTAAVVDANGSVTTAAVWVDATGAVV